jgi:glycine/D-amino acid oxidase-like deaminating enzyme
VKKDLDAIVVGAGLFGAVISKALLTEGRSVLTIDDNRPLSGSAPSGSLMKPGWFSGMGKDVTEPSLELLGDIYNLKTIEFRIWPSQLQTSVYWISTREILDGCDVGVARVTKVRPGVVYLEGRELTADLVVVAAGVWSSELLPVPGLEGRQGVSFRIPGQMASEPFIRPWAPYKQAVAFQEDKETVWAGDGSAILPKNWTDVREAQSMNRMAKQTGMQITQSHATVGIRPYVKGAKPCLLEERSPGLWIATGGAKNGLVAAGWCAHEIMRRTA